MENFKIKGSIFYLALIIVATLGFFNFFPTVHASAPSLSLTSNNNGDTVQVNVTGDANASVLLYYIKTGVGVQIVALGATNSSGSFSNSVSTSSFQIAPDSSVYVILNGINGQQSNSVVWPIVATSNSNTISLSQTGVVLSVGQSASVTASNSSSNLLYLSNNSNPPVANITISGNRITITANTYGSTVATVCLVGNSSNCASVYITVQNANQSPLSFGQSNITIASGQSVPVSISGGNGIYIVQNNPNPSVVQTSINGSVITLSTSSSSGSSSITICSSDINSCGILNVTVGAVSSSTISFSQSNPSISVGQSTNVIISGGSGVYYISANSNPSIVQANLSGNTLTLLGNTNGSSLITICSSTGGCGSITVTANYISNGGSIALSQNSLTLLTGQTLSITISGGEAPYSLPYPSNNIFQASLNGNIVTIYGVSIGSSSLSVCSAGGACVILSITVNSTGSTNQPYLGQNNISIETGQSATVSISGNGGYYVSSNSSSNVASVQISVNSVIIYASNAGNTNISICQSGGQCSILYVSVSAPVIQDIQPIATPITPQISYYNFSRYLGYGDNGGDVLQLQKLLSEQGYLTAIPNGHYGPATTSAVKKFQQAHGISAVGSVGPITINSLNQIAISGSGASANTSATSQVIAEKQQQILVIQQTIQQLIAQLSQMQGQ